jgi:hypothetical protein
MKLADADIDRIEEGAEALIRSDWPAIVRQICVKSERPYDWPVAEHMKNVSPSAILAFVKRDKKQREKLDGAYKMLHERSLQLDQANAELADERGRHQITINQLVEAEVEIIKLRGDNHKFAYDFMTAQNDIREAREEIERLNQLCGRSLVLISHYGMFSKMEPDHSDLERDLDEVTQCK